MDWLAVNWWRVFEVVVPFVLAVTAFIKNAAKNQKQTQELLETMQKDIKEDIKSTKEEVKDVQQALERHIREDEESKAQATRYRILRFYDEVCESKNHSESHFEDVLDDIDFYESYCQTHPKFKNSRGKAAMGYIQEVYHKVKAKGGFLTHE